MVKKIDIDHEAHAAATKKMAAKIDSYRATARGIIASVEASKSGWVGSAANAHANSQDELVNNLKTKVLPALDDISEKLHKGNTTLSDADEAGLREFTSGGYLNL